VNAQKPEKHHNIKQYDDRKYNVVRSMSFSISNITVFASGLKLLSQGVNKVFTKIEVTF